MFRRTVDGRVLDFGISGVLRFSNLIIYDRQTESWWQQIDGEAIVGELLGTKLELIPSPLVSWAEFKLTNPDGKILDRNTGFSRPYGENPYIGYDTRNSPFLYDGPLDDRLSPIERVAALEVNGEAVAFPFSVLEKEPVVHQTIGGQEVVIFFKKGTASALDSAALALGRDVGATGVFIPEIDGQTLTFRMDGGEIMDNETRSTWSLLGKATSGPLSGKALEPVAHTNNFWFSWVAFKPGTTVYKGKDES